MENTKKSNLGKSLMGPISLAALMFSTYVGPGFASGTQTVSYFLTKGWAGVLIGPAICGILCFIICYLNFEFNRHFSPANYREQSDMIFKNTSVRKVMGSLTDIITLLNTIIASAAMVSGAATLLNNMWGVPMIVGTLGFAAAVLLIAMWGTGIILKAGNLMTICIILFTVYFAIIAIGPTFETAMAWIGEKHTATEFGFNPIYAWYIIVCFDASYSGRISAIPACKDCISSQKDSLLAALFTALIGFLGTVIYTLVFAAAMPEITKEGIPTLYVLQNIIGTNTFTQVFYVVVAIVAMLSSAVSFAYATVARFKNPIKKVLKTENETFLNAFIIIAIIVISTGLSKFGILAIVTIGFTYISIVKAPITVFIPALFMPARIKAKKKEQECA